MNEQARLERIADMALLADFYGPLLTEKQRQALCLFYEEDLSLGEIASECACTRQAAHDLIKRGEALLTEYEQNLRLVQRYREKKRLRAAAERELSALGISCEQEAARAFWQVWRELCAIEEGED